MTERKNLTVIQVKELEKVGAKQIPKLTFKATDGDKEHWYQTFRSSLFDVIKEGAIIDADVDVSTREWEGQEYTDRRIAQIYVDGQPVGGKKQGFYRGKSPEELTLSAKAYALSYAKDLAVAQVIALGDIVSQADKFYTWLKGNGNKPSVPKEKSKPQTTTEEQEFEAMGNHEESQQEPQSPTGLKVQNITELKGLMSKYKIGTREAYEILSVNSFMELVDLDEAWTKLKEAKGIE